MAGTTDIFGRSTIFQGQASLSNHFTSVGADDVNTEHTVSLGINDNLDHTVRVIVGTSTRVSNKWVSANLVLDAGCLEFLFGLANPGNFRVCVDDGGDGVVVDVTVAGSNHLGNGKAFVFSLVGQHGTERSIANATYVGHVRLEFRVDNDPSTVVKFNTNVFQAQALSVRTTTNGNEDNIRFELQ